MNRPGKKRRNKPRLKRPNPKMIATFLGNRGAIAKATKLESCARSKWCKLLGTRSARLSTLTTRSRCRTIRRITYGLCKSSNSWVQTRRTEWECSWLVDSFIISTGPGVRVASNSVSGGCILCCISIVQSMVFLNRVQICGQSFLLND